MHIPILLGTTRTGNQSSKVAAFLQQQLRTMEDMTTEVLNLGEAHFPMLEERIRKVEDLPPLLQEWVHTFQQADGIIIVSPEYKNSLPGSLKNFLDLLPAGAFHYKPVGIASVTSGALGGINALAHLRLICLSLKGMPIPDRFMVSHVQDAFDEQGQPVSEKLMPQSDKFLRELVKYAKAFRAID